MVVYRNRGDLGLPSQVSLDNNGLITEFTKNNFKPTMQYIEYGLNVFSKKIIYQVAGKSFPISRYFDLLIKNKQLAGYESPEVFYEVGSFEGIRQITEIFSRK